MSEARSDTDDSDEMSSAIKIAKAFLLKAFKDETIENLALEEVQHDMLHHNWDITLGFNRPRVIPALQNDFLQFAAIAAAARPPRVYKVVKVDMNQQCGVSIKNRQED
jgi:hypothetical protein